MIRGALAVLAAMLAPPAIAATPQPVATVTLWRLDCGTVDIPDVEETLASTARLRQVARNLHATVILAHEPRDTPKLPAFPQGAS